MSSTEKSSAPHAHPPAETHDHQDERPTSAPMATSTSVTLSRTPVPAKRPRS